MKVEDIQLLIDDCSKCTCISKVLLTKPKVFYKKGYNPKVMIIGHSPTVRNGNKVEVVLNMDKPARPLYKYLNDDILSPLNIAIEDVYCTNLIKCFTNGLPEEINKNDKNFINNVSANCMNLLEKEIEALKPSLIISLSERVLGVLSEKYMGKKLKMKESFGKLYTMNISNMNMQYIPVVHIPKYGVKKHYLSKQTRRLSLLGEREGLVPNLSNS